MDELIKAVKDMRRAQKDFLKRRITKSCKNQNALKRRLWIKLSKTFKTKTMETIDLKGREIESVNYGKK